MLLIVGIISFLLFTHFQAFQTSTMSIIPSIDYRVRDLSLRLAWSSRQPALLDLYDIESWKKNGMKKTK